nr:MAG TPA: hypothetical protein [Caudoviricetes sp.]
MERLTLEGTIKYIKEVVQKNRKNKERNTILIPNSFISSTDCAEKYEQVAEWLEELKSYKDLEEQGLFVRLPCKVGATVWELCLYDDGNYKIFPMIVKTISEYGTLRQVKKDKTIWNIYAESDYTYMYKSFADFGKTVFSTKEEAEKKLEEMKK